MQDVFKIDNQHKNKARLSTILVHLAILALLLLINLPIPYPIPEEQGILIAFGSTDDAFGSEQAEVIEPQEVAEVAEQSSSQTEQIEQEEVLTQDYYDAPVVNQETNNDPSVIESEEVLEEEPKEEVVPEIKKPVLDMNALYTGRKSDKNKDEDQGKSTGDGDQGKQNGDQTSTNIGDISYGLGDEGFSFALNGRSIINKPRVNHSSQTTGIVVVRIQVDEEGNVISADYTSRGSTTSDPYLIGVAKKAAQKSKFSAHPSGQKEQWGSITFVFKVK